MLPALFFGASKTLPGGDRMSEIVRGRIKGHLVVDNNVIDGLLEIGGIDLAGFYIALKRFVDRRESVDSNTAMPWTVDYFCQKFKMGKDRFYRLAEMLWGVGLLDVVKEYGSQKGAWGWRNRYAIHDDPGYEGPLRIIREGTFRCPKTGRARNSDTGIPKTKVLGIPAIGIPIAGREENKTYRKNNVVVVTAKAPATSNGLTGKDGDQAQSTAPTATDTPSLLTGKDGDQAPPGFANRVQEAFIEAVGHPLPGKIVSELSGYPLDYVLGKIAMMKQGKEKSNAVGWLLEACREDYQHLPVKAKKKPSSKKSPAAPRLPDTSKDDKYRDLYRLV